MDRVIALTRAFGTQSATGRWVAMFLIAFAIIALAAAPTKVIRLTGLAAIRMTSMIDFATNQQEDEIWSKIESVNMKE